MKQYHSINVSFLADHDISADITNGIEKMLYGYESVQIHSSARPATYTLNIQQENMHDFNPREDDNIGTMRCAHNRYNLGDEESDGNMVDDMLSLLNEHCNIDVEDELGEELDSYVDRGEFDEIVQQYFDKHFISVPLYLYEH